MNPNPRIYITKKKKRIRRTVELELTERAYLNGGVGLCLTISDVNETKEDVPTNNELGIDRDDKS